MTPDDKRRALLAAVLEERFPRAAILAESLDDLVDAEAVRLAKAERARVEAEFEPAREAYRQAWRRRHAAEAAGRLRSAS